MLKINKN